MSMILQKKVKKKRWLTLNTLGLFVLVVVIAANFYLRSENSAAQKQVAGLNSNIAAARQQIDAVAEPASGLESRLEAIKAELADAQAGFPPSVVPNEVIGYIIETAEDYHVETLPLQSDGWTLVTAGQEYNTLVFNVSGEGSLGDVKRFINAIQNGRYPTLTISDFNIQRTGVDAFMPPLDSMGVRVRMKVNIFTLTPGEAV